MTAPRTIEVPFERLPGWIERYDDRHPGTVWSVDGLAAAAVSPDDSRVTIPIPIGLLGNHELAGFLDHLARPWLVGVVLVRKGGFAVARMRGAEVEESKLGRRHVQGKTKAGGWSQQRFARRRDNQARAAYDAASGYVHQILLPHATELDQLVTGGDKTAVDAVFGFRALSPLLAVPQRWLAGVSEPDRATVDRAVASARSVALTVTDTLPR